MEHTQSARIPAPQPAVPPLRPDRAHWTPARQRIFLAALLETGSVARAADAAGMSRSSAQRLRRRLAGTPFDRSWDQVLAVHARRLADPLGPDPLTPAAPAPRR
ncbi:LysR family transcriptional regulator [Sphingomonas sp. MS122]|uniref:LysR family transcriptional regulator n=1 Tax=Sphingomonas sp. MS122 TaxID=3412683 RepID=UPI003C2C7FF9